jgi:hypothetical protein
VQKWARRNVQKRENEKNEKALFFEFFHGRNAAKKGWEEDGRADTISNNSIGPSSRAAI